MSRIAALIGVALLAASNVARAETIATLTLDGFSFIAFGDKEVVALPPGSTLKLRFEKPAEDGSVAFTIAPADVSIAPIALRNGQTLAYAIARPAAGTMSRTASGRKLEFTATIRATLSGGGNVGSHEYRIPFTTESTTASDGRGARRVTLAGARAVEGAGYLQLVGATTNQGYAYPGPGAAVYTVLSGSLDRMP